MFALQFLSHALKALFFNQNSPKMKLFLQKNAKFSSAGGKAPRPPKQPSPLRISSYAPARSPSCIHLSQGRRQKIFQRGPIKIECINY